MAAPKSTSSSSALIVILSFILSSSSAPAAGNDGVETSKEFIRTRCKDTEKPPLCFEILAPHADTVQLDPVHLFRAASNVSLGRVLALASIVSKLTVSPTDAAELKKLQSTCNEELGYAVEEMRDAMRELEAAEGAGLASHADAARQHLDAASTNVVTCSEEFDGEGVENAAGLKEAAEEMQVVLAYTDVAYRLVNHFVFNPSS